MADFRQQLYERYVSTFTKSPAVESEAARRSQWTWFRFKILPLLREVDRTAPILELGCGSGRLLAFLESEGFENVLGVDVSREQVELASGQGLTAVQADVTGFLSRGHKYQAILAFDLLEHFTKDELLPLLTAVYDSLESKGVLVFQTPNGQGLFPNQVVYGDLTHMTIFNPGSLEQILNLVGFENIEVHETGPVPGSLKGRVRVVLWAFIRAAARVVRQIETGKTQTVWTENLLCRCRRP
jgi:2-polyprenyl-3-methyl-5-hydroxy-6-metoxy-1,4-benzoquinol methylase